MKMRLSDNKSEFIYGFLEDLHKSNNQAIAFTLKKIKEDLESTLSVMVSQKLRLFAFVHLYDIIPDSIDKYELFNDVYAHGIYNFDKIPGKVLKSIGRLKPESIIDELNAKVDNEGYITIYRGENERSNKIEKALSWTLDYDIAKWFSVRSLFDEKYKECKVYSAKIKVDKIISYIDDRKEKEVIVMYNDIQIVKVDEFETEEMKRPF